MIVARTSTSLNAESTEDLRVRKQHFVKTKKGFSKAFQWDSEARASLADYSKERDWVVVESLAEADIEIAKDFKEGDMVISQDSDVVISRFLEYKITEEPLATIAINRSQLIVLGIVSHDDYSRNLFGLGCATNFNIVKHLPDSDIPAMVAAYLVDTRVILKNKDDFNFEDLERVQDQLDSFTSQITCALRSINGTLLEPEQRNLDRLRTVY
ncbi:hypothetical protein BGZ98_004421 [Dissophora globulifera]|nr:hypothetical protein BGZ98_004421 [Dissophora globulifera]